MNKLPLSISFVKFIPASVFFDIQLLDTFISGQFSDYYFKNVTDYIFSKKILFFIKSACFASERTKKMVFYLAGNRNN